jgi:DNA-binding transcriptional ArsR family regulator
MRQPPAHVCRHERSNGLAEVGALIGDPARANMLSTLLDGRAHTTTELAANAGVALQTASWHLTDLTAGELLVSEKQGRSRYYRLASPLVAQMLETALTVATARRRRHEPSSRLDGPLRTARTCYDHLAGRLGVEMTVGLMRRRCLVLSRDGGELTTAG